MRNLAGSAQRVPSTILIVEDHDVVRANLYDWLSATFAEHCFLEARSCEEALEIAAAQPLEVVLIDIGLPRIDGIEATRRIRAAAPRTHVVILSIHEEHAYRAAAAAAGACAYVCKRMMNSDLLPALMWLLS